MKTKYFVCIAILLGLSLNSLADERIQSYQSLIEVQPSGTLFVTETIAVQAEGKNIRRGIYRDIPTSYPHEKYGDLGLVSQTPIEVISVTRNGNPEPWHTKDLDNGLRIFIGQRTKDIKRGLHRYVIEYRAHRQLKIENTDVFLYWNVTGNDWRFAIDKVSLTVRLPDASELFDQELWTGRQGRTEKNASFSFAASSEVLASTNRPLKPFEGMTVRVGFVSSGLVMEAHSEAAQLIFDNKPKFLGLGLLLLASLFLCWRWWVQGRDPLKRPIVATYHPLPSLSAAGHRSVLKNAVDSRCFSVAVLSLAVKGWITIKEKGRDQYTLSKSSNANQEDLSNGEEILYYGFFQGDANAITLGGTYSSKIKSLRDEFNQQVEQEFAKMAHRSNTWPLIVGGVLGLIGLVLWYSGMTEKLRAIVFFNSILGLVAGTIISAFLGYKLGFIKLHIGLGAVIAGVIISLFTSWSFALPILFFGILFSIFTYLMPAPKQKGQRLIEQIEGFRLYLAKAEHDSLKRLELPEKTPKLYEQLLPYAIALDLETQWSEQFTDVLTAAEANGEYDRHGSSWYRGTRDFSHSNAFASSLAAGLATSVVAASTAPTSSSSSGGGSSGGGGGGGGGGGW